MNFNAYHSQLRLGRCPMCNRMYEANNYTFLAERDQHVLTYVKCSQCGSAILSLLTLNQQGLQAVGLVTDLTSDEVVHFEQSQPVSTNDVLQLHEALEKDRRIIPNS